MNIRECYETALSFVSEVPDDNPEIEKFTVAWCNVLLGEMLGHENTYRRANKLEELSVPPVLTAEEEEIPYNERLVRSAFPYGMARWIFRESEDVAGSHEYYSLYLNAANDATPVIEGEVKDVYDV